MASKAMQFNPYVHAADWFRMDLSVEPRLQRRISECNQHEIGAGNCFPVLLDGVLHLAGVDRHLDMGEPRTDSAPQARHFVRANVGRPEDMTMDVVGDERVRVDQMNISQASSRKMNRQTTADGAAPDEHNSFAHENRLPATALEHEGAIETADVQCIN